MNGYSEEHARAGIQNPAAQAGDMAEPVSGLLHPDALPRVQLGLPENGHARLRRDHHRVPAAQTIASSSNR